MKSQLARLFEGAFIGDGAHTVIPAPPPASPAKVAAMYQAAWQRLRDARLHVVQLEEQLERILELAKTSASHRWAVADAMLQCDPPPPPSRPVEEQVRVKVLENFSSVWNGRDIWGYPNSIVDVPVGFVAQCSRFFERVPATTPLCAAPLPPR